ncbi:M16 family metallopeptidase [Coralliovum pocilloporae]|uniref:M16 family metallopeptidase n=1 Tax=Coralliovum pocilloporae TaxID=3066369 RepID=UPI003306E4AD
MSAFRNILATTALVLPLTVAIPSLGFAQMGVSIAEAEARTTLPTIAANLKSFTLANGLQVLVIPDRRAPVVTHMIWYKVGSADEPPGKSGIAHFLEHLMFKGTSNHPDGYFSKVIAELGGQENAFTSYDYTGYFQRVAKQHLGLMMELEADRMSNLVLTDEVVLPERKVILEERNERIENSPGAQLGEAISAALFQNHRYGIPIIGWRHEMETLSREDALAFYDRYYTPNNAILVVAGDVTAEDVKGLAEKTYGKVARRAEPGERVRPQEPPARTARTVTMVNDRVNQPMVRRSYLVPSYANAADGEAEALDVLGQVFGAGATSYLYQKIVVEQKIAATAGGWYGSSAYDDTTFGLYGVPLPGKTLTEVEAAIDETLAEFIKSGLTEDDVERAKRSLIADTIYAQDSQTSLARIFGASLTSGETIEAVQGWPEAINKVSVEDVRKAASRWLDKRRSVTGYLKKSDKDV